MEQNKPDMTVGLECGASVGVTLRRTSSMKVYGMRIVVEDSVPFVDDHLCTRNKLSFYMDRTALKRLKRFIREVEQRIKAEEEGT